MLSFFNKVRYTQVLLASLFILVSCGAPGSNNQADDAKIVDSESVSSEVQADKNQNLPGEAERSEAETSAQANGNKREYQSSDVLASIYDRAQFERDIRQAVSATLGFWYSFEKADCVGSGHSDNCYRLLEDRPSVSRWDRFVSVDARMRLLRSLVSGKHMSSDTGNVEFGSVFHVNNDRLAEVFSSQLPRPAGDVIIPVAEVLSLSIKDPGFRATCPSDNQEHSAVELDLSIQAAEGWSEEFVAASSRQKLSSKKIICFNIFDGMAAIVDLPFGYNY